MLKFIIAAVAPSFIFTLFLMVINLLVGGASTPSGWDLIAMVFGVNLTIGLFALFYCTVFGAPLYLLAKNLEITNLSKYLIYGAFVGLASVFTFLTCLSSLTFSSISNMTSGRHATNADVALTLTLMVVPAALYGMASSYIL